jgi:hypothetical protein
MVRRGLRGKGCNEMQETIEKTKSRLSREFLGRDGVHAVGLRRAESTIVVYASGLGPKERAALQRRLTAAALPHRTKLIDAMPPTIAD